MGRLTQAGLAFRLTLLNVTHHLLRAFPKARYALEQE
jgi:hypothetical protein